MVSLPCLRGEKSEVNPHNSYADQSTAPATHRYQHQTFSWPARVGGILIPAIVEWETAFSSQDLELVPRLTAQDKIVPRKLLNVGMRDHVSPPW